MYVHVHVQMDVLSYAHVYFTARNMGQSGKKCIPNENRKCASTIQVMPNGQEPSKNFVGAIASDLRVV